LRAVTEQDMTLSRTLLRQQSRTAATQQNAATKAADPAAPEAKVMSCCCQLMLPLLETDEVDPDRAPAAKGQQAMTSAGALLLCASSRASKRYKCLTDSHGDSLLPAWLQVRTRRERDFQGPLTELSAQLRLQSLPQRRLQRSMPIMSGAEQLDSW
jgi:hypothetical protein